MPCLAKILLVWLMMSSAVVQLNLDISSYISIWNSNQQSTNTGGSSTETEQYQPFAKEDQVTV